MSRTTLFGPPGSGKTTTLSKWATQAASKYGGENVMICSLTKTAATEIRSRSTDVPAHNVGTLHAHAYRSIESDDLKVMGDKQAEEFNTEMPTNYHIPINRGANEDPINGMGSSSLAKADLLRSKCVPVGDWHPVLQGFWNAYSEFKDRNNLLDFTDMIEYALDHVDCPVGYLILDEAQDCSALEFKLLEKWADQCKGVVIAGDDDQAAYEWRGASVDAFLGFSEDHRVLPRSYRLPKRVKEYADKWIHQISNRKEKEYEPRDGIGHVAELDSNQPEDIVEHALRQPGTSMILTTCGYMTLPYVGCLKENADSFCNPYRVSGDFASSWNPMAAGSRGTVTAADSVRAFLSPPWTFGAAHSWVREMSSDFLTHGTKSTLKRMKDEECYVPPDRLLMWLGETGLQKAMAGDLSWWLSTVRDKKRRPLLTYRVRVAMKHGLEGLSPTPDLILGTIHSVKGGQADNVYLVPDLSLAGREAFAVNEDPIIRQMYIGMTRAKEKLFLVRPKRRSLIQW